jgi:hypothetical protein
MPAGSVVATQPGRSRSWMAPQAKSEDLLYISDYGLCSDTEGDLFVTDETASQVYEYAHGSTKRLKTLYDNYVDFGPIDCSVDPTTGNLAVSSADSGFVVIFPKAEEKPKAYYEDAKWVNMYRCAYDNKGDLFVDQVSNRSHNNIHRRYYIGELPKGATRFTNYLLNPEIIHPGGIQFDGKHIAIEDLGSDVLYRLSFPGSKAIVVGSSPLNGTTYVQQYWIQGKMLIGPDSNTTVYFWKYPRGGSPVKSIVGFALNYGSTVSVGH